tara:strand:+ start:980 stop:3505 length:2526 start_codon:yes stop_codon:yes gene_type:complete
MARTKIDYGIDLGTTNSAISRIENGEIKIIKSLDTQKDTSPSCVAFNKKGSVLVGDSAYRNYRSDSLKALAQNKPLNAFVEFKRTMGTDKKYHSSNIDKEFSSEELSSEILKRMKEYVNDDKINAVVVTVPAAFKNNQIDATRRSGHLAGFNQVEILQEPVAASMAYGLESENKDGFWLVFDFGGGTFDAALLKVEDGIMKVIDTEGDNYLGGKNLDYVIVDEIIIPHIKENFTVDELISDDNKNAEYRSALKFFAEEIKNNLSFNPSHNIYVDPGDCGEDDEGEEIEIDLTVSQDQLSEVLSPVFQKAIDCSLNLLKRNNLNGDSLDSLILVGGPTLSPILREMLKDQICEPDTSSDPMTVVSKGAALYASTINLSEEIKEESRDNTKLQLEIDHEASSVETEEFVTLKILDDKTDGEIPEKVFAVIARGDGAWTSEKVEINKIGEIFDVQLSEGKTNVFNITTYDDNGNTIVSEPTEFNIIQGSKIGSATLPYNIGIEIKQKSSGKIVFTTVKGLEKNSSLPATGTLNGLKTQKQIRPGNEKDFLKIPVYQGEHEAEGTRAIYNEHVYDIIINGNDLPSLLPENSEVDLTISLDKSQEIKVEAFFPYLDHTAEIDVPTDTVQSVDSAWLSNEIKKAKGSLVELNKGDGNHDKEKLNIIGDELNSIESLFNKNKNDVDGKQQVVTNLRKTLKKIDEISFASEWPSLEKELKEEFYKLEKIQTELGNEKTQNEIDNIKLQLEEILLSKDVKLGNLLKDEILRLFISMTFIYQLMNFIEAYDENFNDYNWKDSNKARDLLNQGKEILNDEPNTDELHPLVISLINLLPDDEKPSGDDTVLTK